MGHSGGVEPACRVLPIIDEESESEMDEGSPERKVDDRRKVIVSRMRELLRRAVAQSSAQSKLRSTVLVSAKKWKRVVVNLQNSRIAGARKQEQQLMTNRQSDGGMCSSPASSKGNSFSWDIAAGAESCSSSPAQSPLWPALRQFSPSPATRLRRDSSGSADDRMSMSCSGSPDDNDYGDSSRMCQWITTDSDFVVLEL
ncbi:hypothetical protein E2562_025014 [Oryza meyeriana var. granulata]|uniref:Uncharacterized protein n=1 Tax=Oryza meyeriana var. granulata TaxID=110450 RepID=A0A6G1FC43_9ORYZ|nr:hypothetical protein E2562_025014 [Oryza meyeriana var. granulata]